MKRFLLSVVISASLIPAQADLFQYDVSFSSAGEALPSTGTGFGTVNYDNIAHTLQLQAIFSGLQGTTTASHIHAATAVAGTGGAGVATTTPSFAFFPLGVTSGSFSNTLDLTSASSWNASYITAHGGTTTQAELDLVAAFGAGTAYWNIHSSFGTGGEIRGFVTAVPEPTSAALFGLSLVGITARVWSQRRTNKS